MSSPHSYSTSINPTLFSSAFTRRFFFHFPLINFAAANGKKARRELWLIALLMLCAAGSAHAQTCSAMSLGNGASLNGFVPFPSTNAWNTSVASLPPDPNSAAIVAAAGFTGLSTHVNFGSSEQDGGIPYVIVDSTQTAPVSINVIDYASQSDVVLAPFPLNAPMEGDLPDCSGWPDTYNGDAHVLVLDRAKCVLYETWNTNRCNGQYNASSETAWDMKDYESRPWGWTSADAAGLPVFPGLVRYDEVASGAINHAIRFTMQHTKNDSNGGYFVEPASHAAGTDWGVSNIMGMRIRLKASFDISGYSPANQVILTAMQQYGMILADNGGNFFIQGATDPRWDDADLANLAGIPSSEFDVMPITPEFPGYDAATAPTGGLPVINRFTATATSVSSGSPVTFDYNVSGDSYDFIDMMGPVTAGTGSITINPTATQTYTLYSTNAYGQSVSNSILVSVPGSIVDAPILTPPGGAYPAAQTVTMSTTTDPYAAIYYTTDGSTPTYPITGTTKAYPVTPAPQNSQGTVNSITVSSSETVKAIAVAPGYSSPSAVGSATYTIGVASAAVPTFSPNGGTFTSAQQVTISTATTSGSPAIYYTTDGTTPTYPITGTTKLYSGVIRVSASETLNAIAVATGYSNSAEGSAYFTINLPEAATPAFNPPAGHYGPAQSVQISTGTTTGSPAIYYTTDGSTPTYPVTGTTKLYIGAITVSTSETLKAITAATGLQNSAVGSATYVINGLPSAATPTFTIAPGTYTSVQSVVIQSATAGAVIYYTTDGSDPATSSSAMKYNTAISIALSETINAVAQAPNYNNSAVGSAAYIINLPFPGPQYVQSCNQTGSYATSVTCTLNGVGVGHTLVIAVVGGGIVQSATVTSSSGTPTLAVKDGDTLSAYILPNTTAGTINIIAAVSADQTYWLSVYEYANTAISPLDGTGFTVATNWTTPSISSQNITTTAASDTLWSYCLAPGGYVFTAGSAPIPWSVLPAPSGGYETFAEDGATTAAGTYYGQCDTGSGVAIPEIITLALKPPPPVLTPTITSVSPIVSAQTQTITITGSGFGSQSAYTGNSNYIQLEDATGSPWYAGKTADGITLAVSSWTDTQIVLAGFSGNYGTTHCIRPGDHLSVSVWNAQTGNGPAVYPVVASGGTDNCPTEITSVSPIVSAQTQTITITGAGFGTQAAYTGNSNYIQLVDTTGSPWYAGKTGDGITLAVSSWTDSQIVLAGLSGNYGTTHCIRPGDHLTVSVWNAQTGTGTASSSLVASGGTDNCPTQITSVSPIVSAQTQTITISGAGFGTQAAYTGNSNYIQLEDTTGTPWFAGKTGDGITLDISSWTDSQIVFTGFSGNYGTSHCIRPGDHLIVSVWNAQTGTGTASYALVASGGTDDCATEITSVSVVLPQETQTITITGKGFGTQAAFTGDSNYIELTDTTRSWNAGHTGDGVTLGVSSWSDSQIVLSGFSGSFGPNHCIAAGDHLAVSVWNAQTGAGPAVYPIVASSGTSTCH